MAKIPNFAGAEKLSLTDLQALADAVAGQERVLPPAPLSGRIGSRKYSLANFNRVDESTGVSIPANPGLIESVVYESGLTDPKIVDGSILLPSSGGGGADITEVLYTSSVSSPVIDSGTIKHPYAQTDLEGSSVAGVVSGRIKSSNVSYPFAENGDIVLPWAQSVSSVYGLVCGVESNSAVTAPMITDGVILLPSASETLTEVVYTSSVSTPFIESCSIKHPYAQTSWEGSSVEGSSVAGVMSGRIKCSNVMAPSIENGDIVLPWAQTSLEGSSVTGLIAGVITSAVSAPIIQDGQLILPQSGGTVLGLRDMYGNPIAWADLYTSGAQQTSLAQFTAGGTTLTLCANFSDGYINFEFRS